MAQINLIGETILGYTVIEKLGEGAFGTVYKVSKTNASGQYIRALKHISIPTEKQYYSVLNSMGGDVSKADSYFTQMLNNIVSEIKILNDLSEKGVPHIVRYYENDILVSEEPRRYDVFILMEYLTSLEDFIKEKDFLVRDVVKLAKDVLHGLQACHNNGVIHRDIKDDNIFVSEKGEYKIGDFGVSKVLKDSSKAESLKGTPNFLAPEVYLGKEGYTKNVDLYSLGIVLYRLLNYNRNPFLPHFPEQYFSHDEDNAFEERMSGKTPSMPSLGGEYIGRVIIQAIAKKDERFQSADEFLSALDWAINNTPADILDTKIKFNVASSNESKVDAFHATLKESRDVVSDFEDTPIDEARKASINKHLFESVSEKLVVDVPKNVELPTTDEAEKSADVDERVTSDDSETKKKSKTPVVTATIFAIVLLVGVGIFAVQKLLDDNDSTNASEASVTNISNIEDYSNSSEIQNEVEEHTELLNTQEKEKPLDVLETVEKSTAIKEDEELSTEVVKEEIETTEEKQDSIKENTSTKEKETEKDSTASEKTSSTTTTKKPSSTTTTQKPSSTTTTKKPSSTTTTQKPSSTTTTKKPSSTTTTQKPSSTTTTKKPSSTTTTKKPSSTTTTQKPSSTTTTKKPSSTNTSQTTAASKKAQQKEKTLKEAKRFANSGDYVSAIKRIKNAQKSEGDNADYKAALTTYKKKYKTAVIKSADLLASAGDYIGALETIKAASSIIGNNKDFSNKIAGYEKGYVEEIIRDTNALIKNKDFNYAENLIKEALGIFPKNKKLISQKNLIKKNKTTK